MKIPSTVAPAAIDAAVVRLREGAVIAFPTDTLYALGADATNRVAVARVFEIKGREGAKPLPLFVSGLDMAAAIAEVTPVARRLAERYWPGALTIVLRKRPDFESEALVGGATVALRVPNHEIALRLVTALDRPVIATSANLSGGPDPVSADEVRRQLDGRVDLILDGGPCAVGVSSTIVDCSGEQPRVLREGAIPTTEIDALVASATR
jgi:L-threonylcarbamoyladenylate synthase